jgi:hypothetical protein
LATKKKQKHAEPRRFPALELRTAGWLLGCWANRSQDSKLKSERRRELLAKVPLVQKAITGATRSGKHANPDGEILLHEYAIVKRAVDGLYERMGDEPTSSRNTKIADARCIYEPPSSIEGVDELSRPLFIVPATMREVQRSTRESRRRPAELAEKLTAELFGIKDDWAHKKLSGARKQENAGSRFYRPPTETELFLVSAFMLQMRRDADQSSDGVPSRILTALFDSGYDAKAIYHLTRFVSTVPSENRNADAWESTAGMDWETVDFVCRSLTKSGQRPTPPPTSR